MSSQVGTDIIHNGVVQYNMRYDVPSYGSVVPQWQYHIILFFFVSQ